MSKRSSGVKVRYSGDSTWSLATKNLCWPFGAVKIAVSGWYVPSVRNCKVKNGWVVPPFLKLISMAYGSHLPFERTTTKSRAKRPITPSLASRLPTFAASCVMSDAKLDTGASEFLANDSLFHDSFSLFQFVDVAIVGRSLQFELHGPEPVF